MLVPPPLGWRTPVWKILDLPLKTGDENISGEKIQSVHVDNYSDKQQLVIFSLTLK